jgi:hypothetical protein
MYIYAHNNNNNNNNNLSTGFVLFAESGVSYGERGVSNADEEQN